MDPDSAQTLETVEGLKAYAARLCAELAEASRKAEEESQKAEEAERQRQRAVEEAAEYRAKYEKELNAHELLKLLVYGRRSEKVKEKDVAQGELFNEAEAENQRIDSPEPEERAERAAAGRVKRPGSGRRRPPENLERVEIVHDLPEEEKACPACGAERPLIGEERSEEIDVIPAKMVVTVHVRKTYGPCSCPSCRAQGPGTVTTAPAPAKIAPGSLFSNATIAFIIVSKFVDGLPFYRQERAFERFGLELGRGTMARLAIKAASALSALSELMLTHIRGSPVVRMDETTVQVLKEEGRAPAAESRMWVAMGYRDGRPIVHFAYNPSRSGKVAQAILGPAFSGFLQTDGYSGYAAVGARAGVAHVGCWAHIRRKFIEVHKTQGSQAAMDAVRLIRKLYMVEKRLRCDLESGALDAQAFLVERRAATEGPLAEILSWLVQMKAELAPQSPLGKAVEYALGQYERAARYTEHALLTPDNNLAENAIRPFVIGRKNWRFADTPAGAWASATLYGLVETAKANGHEPYRYLRHLFDELPRANDQAQVQALLPYILRPDEY